MDNKTRLSVARTAFISYASEDNAIATTIADYLERHGVTCWIAVRDARVGADYASEIIDAIETSAVFVLVLSEHANTSLFVNREVERAVSKGKPVFPIRVREVEPSKSLELFISSAHWIDAWQPPMEQYLERLANSIRSTASVYVADEQQADARDRVERTPFRGREPSLADSRRLKQALLVAAILVGVLMLVRSFTSRAPERPSATSATIDPAGRAAANTGAATGTSSTGGAAANAASAAATIAGSPADPCPQSLSVSRDLPTPFTCHCTAESTSGAGTVWGTDVYTDDSSLCRAALHAGVIHASGGSVTVMRMAGRSLYIGSSRNGVASSDYGAHTSSIEFKGTVAATGPTLCPSTFSVNRQLPTPFTCRCTAEATHTGSVWGTDVYTDDSSLCGAALHAGVIDAGGGPITVVRAEGRQIYIGTSRHGIRSSDYGAYQASIRFQSAVGR